MKQLALHSYQQDALEFLSNKPKSALWLPMGSGKSAICLSHISRNNLKTLIVCPLTVISQWQREIEKWDEFNHLNVAVLHGKNKSAEFDKNVDVWLINYEGLLWLANEVNAKKRIPFNTIIYDESTKLKSPTSKRSKIAHQLSKPMKNVILLSGTPSPNGYEDLWSQYYTLDQGERLGKNITTYRNRFFFQIGEYRFNTFRLKSQSKRAITNLVEPVTFRIDESQLPSIPLLSDNPLTVELPARTAATYKKLKTTGVTEGINTTSIAALLNKLRQFTSGFTYTETGFKTIHSAKVDRLKEVLESLQGTPVIVAYNYKAELEMIKSQIGEVHTLGSGQSQKAITSTVKRFNNGEIPVLCVNPASVSHGINLQDACANIIWFSLTYNYEHYVQLIGRIHRQGQLRLCKNHILLVKGTVDELILKALRNKNTSQQFFLDSFLEG